MNIDLTNTVCMSDVSGSMHGTPMLVSIALGILISEIAPDATRVPVLSIEGTEGGARARSKVGGSSARNTRKDWHACRRFIPATVTVGHSTCNSS